MNIITEVIVSMKLLIIGRSVTVCHIQLQTMFKKLG